MKDKLEVIPETDRRLESDSEAYEEPLYIKINQNNEILLKGLRYFLFGLIII